MANPVGIERRGTISLEDGQLVCRKFDGEECGRLLVGVDGLYFDGGELTLCQRGDPPKLRFASTTENGRGAMGAVSWNVFRADQRQEEIAYLKGALAEDNTLGDFRGQYESRIRASQDGKDMQIGFITTTAYSEELFGQHKVWTGTKNHVQGLLKFE